MQDLRPDFSGVAHQGQRSSCLAFATTSAHEQARASLEPLSVEHLFYHAVQRMPGANPMAGTSVKETREALLVDGQPCERAWPYLKRQPLAKDWVPPAHGLPCYSSELVRIDPTLRNLRDRLNAGHAVIAGLVITDNFYRVGSDGHLPNLAPDTERTGHAVLAVGHGMQGNECFVLVRNSWGPGWGMSGHAWLTEHYLETQMVECAVIRRQETNHETD